MQKSLLALASVALTSGVDAVRSRAQSSHPFVGEHADANIIEHETRSTHRAEPLRINVDKYAALKSDMNFGGRKSAETRLYEMVYGESEETLELQRALEYRQKLEKNAKYGKGRLGIDAQAIVEVIDDDVFAANFIMGGRLPMKGILDTATDLVTVESDDCQGC